MKILARNPKQRPFNWNRLTFPMVRLIPQTIVFDFVSVQPMDLPKWNVNYFNHIYEDKSKKSKAEMELD